MAEKVDIERKEGGEVFSTNHLDSVKERNHTLKESRSLALISYQSVHI